MLRGNRWVTPALAGALLVAASACGSGADQGGDAPGTSSAPATSAPALGVLPATDGRTTTMRLQVDLGGTPCGVAVAHGAVWVSLNG